MSNFLKNFIRMILLLIISALNSNTVLGAELEEVILDISVGEGEGQVYCSESMAGGGTGPEAFFVDEKDGKIYLVDNKKKCILVYSDGKYSESIAIPYTKYVRSIVAVDDNIYILDCESGYVYKINKSKVVNEKKMLYGVEPSANRRLIVTSDSCYLTFDKKINDKVFEYSVNVDEAFEEKATEINGIKDEDKFYFIDKCDKSVINLWEEHLDGTKIIDAIIVADHLAEDAHILSVCGNYVYIYMFDMNDTDVVGGKYSIYRYCGENKVERFDVSMVDYHYFPYQFLQIAENGDVFQLICKKDRAEIKRITWNEKLDVKCADNNDAQNTLILNQNPVYSISSVNAPNDYYTTMTNAIDCCNLTWTYNYNNANNPNSSAIYMPNYLKNVSKPSSQTGIPYCWGGFDGLNTSFEHVFVEQFYSSYIKWGICRKCLYKHIWIPVWYSWI